MTQIRDKHNRIISYLRLAVTDKCNMRCTYCMPENIKFLPRNELLSYEEMLRLCLILKKIGISKIRLTGGEPFLRKDMMLFIKELTQFFPAQCIHVTTNGTFINKYLTELKKLGVIRINLSLDTLNKQHFEKITRSKYYDEVTSSMKQMIEMGFLLKLNTVVLQNKNTEDLLDLAKLTIDQPVDVRFIEEMPFNGYGKDYSGWIWNAKYIETHLLQSLKGLKKSKHKTETAILYELPKAKGRIGIIPSWSRTICGQCNRMRITSEGVLRTCLYDEGIFQLRDFIRKGATDIQLMNTIKNAFHHKAKDGFEAQNQRLQSPFIKESMSSIGG